MFLRAGSLSSLKRGTFIQPKSISLAQLLLKERFHKLASQQNNENNNNIFDSKVMEFFKNESSIVEENKSHNTKKEDPSIVATRDTNTTDLKDEDEDLDLETLNYNKTIDSIDDILKLSNSESVINEWNDLVNQDIDNLSLSNGAGNSDAQILEDILNDGNGADNIRDKIKQEKSFMNQLFKLVGAKNPIHKQDTSMNQLDIMSNLNIDNENGFSSTGANARLFDSFQNRRDPLLDNDKLLEMFVSEKLQVNLKPTVDYINNLKYDYEVLQFINDSVLKNYKFNENIDRTKLMNESKGDFVTGDGKPTFDYLKIQSINCPSKPTVDQFSLSFLILTCFQKLINDFPNKLLAILNIFSIYSQIKRSENELQPEIFIYGINIDIFNFLIEHTWNYFLDLQLIYSLIFDLKLNGVVQNDETIKIVEKIINELKDLLFENNKRFNRDLTSADLLKSFFEDYETSRSDIWNEEDNKKYNDINKILLNMISQQ